MRHSQATGGTQVPSLLSSLSVSYKWRILRTRDGGDKDGGRNLWHWTNSVGRLPADEDLPSWVVMVGQRGFRLGVLFVSTAHVTLTYAFFQSYF